MSQIQNNMKMHLQSWMLKTQVCTITISAPELSFPLLQLWLSQLQWKLEKQVSGLWKSCGKKLFTQILQMYKKFRCQVAKMNPVFFTFMLRFIA